MVLLSIEIIDDCHVMVTKMHDLIKSFCRFLADRYDKTDDLQKFDQDNFGEFTEYYNEDLTLSVMSSPIARDMIQICDSSLSICSLYKTIDDQKK